MMSAIKSLFTSKTTVVETPETIDPPAAPAKPESGFATFKRFFVEHVGLYRVGTVFVDTREK
ncbi:hypothetical protein BST79_gp356 [Only Syngen Nebraska virus 5]|uniref:hypothetical protein n=1 Tax=Only Syngen Nebraska virus 5 TaxID=1917232 RepID=UPI000900F446|nr:hypothetical protein BST79_gp002 [Only Syngen Nebraska virus 5]YP_009325874.1 hypothetical protein BST79_gp356 [Only Syngen Nebraska virus 5]APC25515.1 hypothetical protein [Only Syngen Nebraska virus 5]APC25869.1 hypothetical protein [Only Syngen Nebraska virus 5]